MSSEPSVVSVEHNGFTVSGNSSSEEAIRSSLNPQETPKPEDKSEDAGEDISKAASTLGKKGGEVAAAKRAEAAKEAAKEAEADEKPEEKAEEKKLGKPRDDPRARMLEATRQAAEAKRERDTERAERERLAQRLVDLERRQAPAKPTAEQPKGDEKPQEEAYENYADFVEARSRWAARQEFEQQFNSRRQAAAQRFQVDAHNHAVEARISQFNGRLEETRKTDPDFMERVAPEILNLPPSFVLPQGQRPGPYNVIADEIVSSDKAPALMLHFTEHPEELQRIATLRTPREVSREMAIIEAGLGAVTAGVSPKPEVSKANPPVRPVTGSPHIAEGDIYRPGMTLDEYARKWKPAKR